ncbi:MAG: DegV family protein [Actinomycetes bacterium]
MSRPGRIGLCTDSSAHLPPELVERFGVVVVPVTLTVDGHDHLDQPDQSLDQSLDQPLDQSLDQPVDQPLGSPRLGGVRPGVTVEVGRPSPGQYALAFEDLVADGAAEVLSLHGATADGSSSSAARLAAHRLEVPVRVIDTRRSGFRLGACVWIAAEAVAAGATTDQAIAAADECATEVVTFTVPSVIGRADGSVPRSIRVLRSAEGDPDCVDVTVGEYDHVLEAVNAVARAVLDLGDDLRVGIGHADPRVTPVAHALAAALGESAAVRDVVHHRLTCWADALAPDALTCTVVPGRVLRPRGDDPVE